WHLETRKGTRDDADVIIAATGVLHHPNIPHFEGSESFAGACFHSSRWDHSAALDGRRVGVIGTGSTAIQITSALTKRVAAFKLFQRTAQWVMPMEDPEYSVRERAAFAHDPGRIQLLREELHRVFVETFSNAVIDADSPGVHAIEQACLANLESSVRDPLTSGSVHPAHGRARSRRRRSRRRLGGPSESLRVGLDPRISQLLHGERAELADRKLLADPDRRVPAGLHPPAHGAAARRR